MGRAFKKVCLKHRWVSNTNKNLPIHLPLNKYHPSAHSLHLVPVYPVLHVQAPPLLVQLISMEPTVLQLHSNVIAREPSK